MKIKYTIKEIYYTDVLIVKLYSKDKKKHIKVGLSFSPKTDKRLIRFTDIPTQCDEYNSVIHLIIGNICRGQYTSITHTKTASKEETDCILYYIKEYCTDPFILDFISDS